METSPQGRQFIQTIGSHIGNFGYVAIDERREGGVAYCLVGDHGVGLLVDERERPDGDEWVRRTTFRYESSDGLVLEAVLVIHRWDPWLHAQETGDRTVLDLPAARRRRETARRSEAIGRAKDTLITRWYLREHAPPRMSGFEVARIEKLARERLSGGAAPEAVEAEPSAEPQPR
jgi:hypothetical protein